MWQRVSAVRLFIEHICPPGAVAHPADIKSIFNLWKVWVSALCKQSISKLGLLSSSWVTRVSRLLWVLKHFIEQERGRVKHLSLSILCHELQVNYEVLKNSKSNILQCAVHCTCWYTMECSYHSWQYFLYYFSQALGDETDFTQPRTMRVIVRFLNNCSEAVSQRHNRSVVFSLNCFISH